jgi:hypothetical protein
MRSILFITSFFWTTIFVGQEITFSNKYDEKDLTESLEMLGLKIFKYEMPKSLKGCYFDFIIKEYYEGVEISSVNYSDKFSKMKQVLLWQNNLDNYTLKIQTLKNDTVETFNARLPGMGVKNYGLRLKMNRREYAWESLFYKTKKIELDAEIPLLAFATNPENEQRPNLAVYCELEGNNYKDWYAKLKVKHYFVFLTRVTKK